MTDKKYKWNNPHEWLDWALFIGKVQTSELMALIHDAVSSDDVQDRFQSEMEADGYFEEERERRLDAQFPDRLEDKLVETDVDECSKCQSSMDLYELSDGKQYLLCCNCEYRDDNYGYDPEEEDEDDIQKTS